jgi:hypothetical protein
LDTVKNFDVTRSDLISATAFFFYLPFVLFVAVCFFKMSCIIDYRKLVDVYKSQSYQIEIVINLSFICHLLLLILIPWFSESIKKMQVDTNPPVGFVASPKTKAERISLSRRNAVEDLRVKTGKTLEQVIEDRLIRKKEVQKISKAKVKALKNMGILNPVVAPSEPIIVLEALQEDVQDDLELSFIPQGVEVEDHFIEDMSLESVSDMSSDIVDDSATSGNISIDNSNSETSAVEVVNQISADLAARMEKLIDEGIEYGDKIIGLKETLKMGLEDLNSNVGTSPSAEEVVLIDAEIGSLMIMQKDVKIQELMTHLQLLNDELNPQASNGNGVVIQGPAKGPNRAERRIGSRGPQTDDTKEKIRQKNYKNDAKKSRNDAQFFKAISDAVDDNLITDTNAMEMQKKIADDIL